MICFHHNDADGRCAAYLVKTLNNMKDDYSEETPRFIETDYGRVFDYSLIRPDELVYIVDFSISPIQMMKLLHITKKVIWIDHHKTAIEKFKDYPEPIPGLRIDGVAACVLTFGYLTMLFPMDKTSPHLSIENDMFINAPLFVQLIADYDVWKFEYGDKTRAFHAGLMVQDYTVMSDVWKYLEHDEFINQVIKEGYIILDYQKTFAKKYIKQFGEKVMLYGYEALAVNIGNVGSDFFKSVEEDYDLYISYVITDGLWRVSLRSPKDIDVSEIAKSFGGGGHKGAAGFQCKELPFKKDVLWYENI